jgi:hypothetical protein
MERSKLVLDKAIDRVRKLLNLAQGTSEHEAASAAASAAALIEQFNLTEAMIRLDEPEAKPEPIEKRGRLEPDLPSHGRKRVAWKETIAQATASDVGVKIYWVAHVDMCGFGRESAIQTWRYTFAYLCRAVDELADKAWDSEGYRSYETVRAWKNAFRVGCAQRLSVRLYEERMARRKAHVAHEVDASERANAHDGDKASVDAAIGAARECQALAVVAKDQAQVDQEYASYSKGWRGTIGSIGQTSSRDGYSAGRAAADRVSLGGKRAGLKAGQGRLR